MWAANNPEPGIVLALLEAGADVDARTEDGLTALMYAARNPNSEIMSALLKSGADVNVGTNEGYTALMAAAQYNSNPDAVMLLAGAGANVDAKSEDNSTALM